VHAFKLKIGQDPLEPAVGAVLAHNLAAPEGKGFLLRKGHRVEPDDLEQLARAEGAELHLIEMEPGDLHEQEAGLRLARAVSGPGVHLRGWNGSQYDLVAAYRGYFRVDADLLAGVNSLEGVTVFSLTDGLSVEEGEELAGVKVTPYVIQESIIDQAERLCAAGAPLRVIAFQPLRVGVVIPGDLDEVTRARFRAAMEHKLGWFGARLERLIQVTDDVDQLTAALRQLQAEGIQVIMTAGASSIDPLEPLFQSLREVGARVEKHGVPVDPGSLFWLAYLPTASGEVPVFGLSSCEMFSHKTILDLILPRVFARQPVDRAALVSLGAGGLLNRSQAYRFPPYGERQRAGSGHS
jgi:hypothetical protein